MARQKEPTWVTENKPFPKALRELMNETNTTQPMLADSIGVTRQTISLYCTGQSTPDIEVFTKIAEYFDVSFDYLLGKSEAKKRENINIHERTGLSDNAINNIMKYKEPFLPVQTNQYGFIPALNKFLENSEFCEFLILLGSYYNNLVDIERHKRDNPGSKITMYGHKFPGPNGKIILNVYEYAEYMRMRFKTMLAEAGSKAVSDYFKFLQEEAQKAIEEER